MKLIAIEEAFSISALTDRHPAIGAIGDIPVAAWFGAHLSARLPDLFDLRLADMDEHGVTMQVLSLTVPGIQATGLPPTDAVAAARQANDVLAAAVATRPDRFAGFAALPLQDPEAAVAELHRAVTDLGLCGALINDHTDGHYLDEPCYEPVWAALEELDVPLYLHPGALPLDRWQVLDMCPELVGPSWSWTAQTSAHALRLVYAGVFDRHPDARLILGHMGELLPFMASRLDSRYPTLDPGRTIEQAPSTYVGRNILITTSGVPSPAALAGAVSIIGADATLFAIDYPYEFTETAVASLLAAPIDDTDREKIAHGNAERLLRI